MASITLVTGGARSGKSAFALDLAKKAHFREKAHFRRLFIATATAFDEEMKRRISVHQKDRGDLFHTIEEPIYLSSAISAVPPETDVVLVDCLTVWTGNLYHHFQESEQAVRSHIEEFLSAIVRVSYDLILVTNEVGWGVVPENPLARSFRDVVGYLNRSVAERAQNVYLLCCGIPMVIK